MPSKKPQEFRATSQDLMNHISRGVADQQLHFVVQCAGRLDPERLRRAVDLCIVAQPILGCLLSEKGKRPHWTSGPHADAWGYSRRKERNTSGNSTISFSLPLIRGRTLWSRSGCSVARRTRCVPK